MSNHCHTVSGDTFEYFKERWDRYCTQVNPTLNEDDRDIFDILCTLNKIDGVVTVNSCGGHQKNDLSQEFNWSGFYISMAVTDVGLKNLISLNARIHQLLKEGVIARDRVSVDILTPQHLTMELNYSLHPNKNVRYYPTVTYRTPVEGLRVYAIRNAFRTLLDLPLRQYQY